MHISIAFDGELEEIGMGTNTLSDRRCCRFAWIKSLMRQEIQESEIPAPQTEIR